MQFLSFDIKQLILKNIPVVLAQNFFSNIIFFSAISPFYDAFLQALGVHPAVTRRPYRRIGQIPDEKCGHQNPSRSYSAAYSRTSVKLSYD